MIYFDNLKINFDVDFEISRIKFVNDLNQILKNMIEFVNEHLKIREKFVNKTFELKKNILYTNQNSFKKNQKKNEKIETINNENATIAQSTIKLKKKKSIVRY